jgi:thiamine biosynthesis protein ThiS
MMMTIELNGETRTLPGPVSVGALVEQLDLDPAKVAVERNLDIVPKSAFASVMLADGDRIEIVHFVGGG